jgi:hypothetical protein
MDQIIWILYLFFSLAVIGFRVRRRRLKSKRPMTPGPVALESMPPCSYHDPKSSCCLLDFSSKSLEIVEAADDFCSSSVEPPPINSYYRFITSDHIGAPYESTIHERHRHRFML